MINKKVLSEVGIYSGHIKMPEGYEIKKDELVKNITVSNYYEDINYPFSKEWDKLKNFIADYVYNGRYSKINDKIKRKILNFFEKNSGNYMYVEGYLFPELHFEDYAKLLDVSVELLQSVGELCSKPDLDKEKLLIKVADLHNIKILD